MTTMTLTQYDQLLQDAVNDATEQLERMSREKGARFTDADARSILFDISVTILAPLPITVQTLLPQGKGRIMGQEDTAKLVEGLKEFGRTLV